MPSFSDVAREGKRCWHPVKAGRGRKDFPSESFEEAQPGQHLNFRCLASTTVREYISVKSHTVCGDLLWQIILSKCICCYCSVPKSYLSLCNPMDCSMLGFPILHYLRLLRFMSVESVMLSNHLIIWRPLLLLSSIFPSIRVFSNESALCIRWPKYWSFSISRSNEYSGLISFSIDWFDLLAIQGTLKSLLQHHHPMGSMRRSGILQEALFLPEDENL